MTLRSAVAAVTLAGLACACVVEALDAAGVLTPGPLPGEEPWVVAAADLTGVLAALVGGGGLGTFIVTGFATQRYGLVVAGGILVAALCLAVEAVLAFGQRALTPRPMRAVAVGR